MPGVISKGVKSFLTRIVVNEPELDITANITQAFEKSLQTAGGMIILDIDVYKEYKEMQLSVDDEQVWAMLGELRNIKNRIFFDSITEKTARLFR